MELNAVPFLFSQRELVWLFYASAQAIVLAEGIVFFSFAPICPFFYPSCSCEPDILGCLFKFCTNIQLDSRIIMVVKGHCDLTKHIIDHNPRIHALITARCHTNVIQEKIMKWWHFISERSASLWQHKVLQKHSLPLFNAITREPKGRLWPYFTFGWIFNWWH